MVVTLQFNQTLESKEEEPRIVPSKQDINSLELNLEDTVLQDVDVAIGTLSRTLQTNQPNISVHQDISVQSKEVKTAYPAPRPPSSPLPTMEIETHLVNGERHSQRVYASGWTPMVIGSVPGIADR